MGRSEEGKRCSMKDFLQKEEPRILRVMQRSRLKYMKKRRRLKGQGRKGQLLRRRKTRAEVMKETKRRMKTRKMKRKRRMTMQTKRSTMGTSLRVWTRLPG